MPCIIRVGTLLEAIINVITLGRGKDIAGWIAKRLGYADCGCDARREKLDEMFGCFPSVRLWVNRYREIAREVDRNKTDERKPGRGHGNAKPIIVTSPAGKKTEYRSITEASEDLNIVTSTISNVLNGHIPHYKGYRFKYKNK